MLYLINSCEGVKILTVTNVNNRRRLFLINVFVLTKQTLIRVVYLYSKCTDCRINIQYWSVDGKYRIYLTRLRNGMKDELLASLSPRFAPSQINLINKSSLK
jgi:hypothetical protein